MSRTSRVPHPSGSRYVAIHVWAVERFGLAGAAIIGLLDFFDRGQSTPGQPLASSARIIADLEGIVGRDSVLRALKTLQEVDVIHRVLTTIPGTRNIENHVRYSLNAAGVARLLETPEIRSSRNSGFQESPEVLKSGLKSGVSSIKELEVEAAAPRAHARGTDSAAAHPTKGKRRTTRASGIVTWDAGDSAEAERIEQQHSADQISAAVSALLTAGKQPVPGLVAREIERQRREHLAAEQRAVTAQRIAAADTQDFDPMAAAKGEQLLAGIRRKSKTQNEVTTHD